MRKKSFCRLALSQSYLEGFGNTVARLRDTTGEAPVATNGTANEEVVYIL